MKINKLNTIIILVYFINIFLALPLIILSILKKKESIFVIGIFFMIIGFYFEFFDKRGDIGFYYSLFDKEYLIRKWELNYQKDYYAKYLIEMLIYFKLPKNLLGGLSAFLTYYYLFKSLFLVMGNRYRGKLRLGIYLIYFMIIPIVGYTGIRYLPSVAMMCYAIILKCKLNSKKYLIYVILSSCIHVSMVFPGIILIMIGKLRLNLKQIKLFLFILWIVGIVIDTKVILILIQKINSYKLIRISPIYITGEWGENYFSQFNVVGKIIETLKLLFSKIIVILYCIFGIKLNKFDIFLFPILGICLLFSRYQTIFSRYFLLILIISFLSILEKYRGYKFIKSSVFVIMSIYITFEFLLELKSYWYDFYISYFYFYKISATDILIQILNQVIK